MPDPLPAPHWGSAAAPPTPQRCWGHRGSSPPPKPLGSQARPPPPPAAALAGGARGAARGLPPSPSSTDPTTPLRTPQVTPLPPANGNKYLTLPQPHIKERAPMAPRPPTPGQGAAPSPTPRAKGWQHPPAPTPLCPLPARGRGRGAASLRSTAPSASAAGSAWPPRCHSPSPAPCRAAERGQGGTVRAAPSPPAPPAPGCLGQPPVAAGGRTRAWDPSQGGGGGGWCCSFQGEGTGGADKSQLEVPPTPGPSSRSGSALGKAQQGGCLRGEHKSPSTSPRWLCPPSASPPNRAAW